MAAKSTSNIRVGIGGWTYEPWRGTFYPGGLPQKRELEYASAKLTSIEINGTYYGSQKPETFAKWRGETPEGFVFAVKGPRFATNRKVLGDAGDSIDRFVNGGLGELGEKLGPINWQFMATKKFDPDDFEAFLKLLPPKLNARPLRHAVEVRHPSFRDPAFVALARKYGVAVVIAGDCDFPQIADPTASFAYLRLMGTKEGEPLGYPARTLDQWVEKARALAAGQRPGGLDCVEQTEADKTAREVFVYLIAGHKVANPAAAMKFIEKLG